jgi:D-alanyl-D-alanine carboxypeptidase/D-alanyl-D-alanine-endopeptidase (penicillin-binding protein 4)
MIIVRRSLLALLLTAGLVTLWLTANGLSSSRSAQPKPAPTSSAAAGEWDAALAHDIDQIIDQSDSARARWGVFVAGQDGHVMYSRDGDKLFTPASNMKIYTTAVALDVLGGDYRWRTSVYARQQPDTAGVIGGDLILYGRGAPDLDSKRKESLPAVVEQLYERGVRRVRGDVIGDESYFRAEMYGVGWQWNDLQWYYGAQPSALTIDENAFEVTIAPSNQTGKSATVVANPGDGYIRLMNNTKTGERDVVTSIGINRGLSNNDVRVWGEFPVGGRSFSAFLSVHNPAQYAATVFKRLLVARGIRIDGDVRSRDFRTTESERFDPQNAVELAFIESASLAEIVHKTNKQSNNLFAELILRTIGKEKGSSAPDPNELRNQTRGDDVAGTAVIGKWLRDHGINTEGLAIQDGSGLSRLDLVTPEGTARLLMVAAGSPWANQFKDSLPTAGRDGTLRGRLANVGERISAKTGSLTYSHSLSGYVTTASGQVLAFSLICNDATGPAHPVRIIDAIATRIADEHPADAKNR